MKKAAIIYMSLTGNTKKVAESIHQGLTEGGVQSVLLKVEDAGEIDFYAYDLICLGTPSHSWLPPKTMDEYLRGMFNRYKKEGRVKPGAPALPGKMRWSSALIPVRTPASGKPSPQGNMWGSILNITVSLLLTNGMC